MLDLKDNDRVIVHRGLSEPICPFAERTRIIANQSRNGYKQIDADVLLAVLDTQEKIQFRAIGNKVLSLKQFGDTNTLLDETFATLRNWWCHVIGTEGAHLALLGRPNKMRLGIDYSIPFPCIVSTRMWKQALQELPKSLVAKTTIQEQRARKYPNMARAYDPIGTGYEWNPHHGTGWILNC